MLDITTDAVFLSTLIQIDLSRKNPVKRSHWARHTLKRMLSENDSALDLEAIAGAATEMFEDINQTKFQLKKSVLRSRQGIVYVVKAEDGLYKIGRTESLHQRLSKLRTDCPVESELLMHKLFKDCVDQEKRLHKIFAGKRVRGEWFRLNSADLNTLKDVLM